MLAIWPTPKKFAQLLAREAMIGSYLQHPNIVETLEFGEEEGRLFLALEFVEGQTIEDLMVGKALRRHQVLPVQLPPTMRGLLPVHDDMGSHGSRTPLLHLGASRCVGSSHWPSRAHSEPPWQSPTPEGWLH